MRGFSSSALILLYVGGSANGFTTVPLLKNNVRLYGNANTKPSFSAAFSASATSASDGASTLDVDGKKDRKKLVKQEGGLFAFDTKYGALNPFAIYYGLTAILLGIPWFIALSLCQLFYRITGGKIDSQRRVPVFINHAWGVLLMRLTFCYPKIINREILKEFYKTKRPAMFVANHCSWDDIPFLGVTIGWRNYKIVAKKELEKVPILGKAIRLAANIEVDRSDRRSQMATFKKGIQFLKDGVHLCTFAEGTRSRSGRLMKFKDGAFKMAYKAGSPVIPIAIVGAQKAHPTHWMFPYKPTSRTAKVVVCEPIESKGITEAELSAKVKEALTVNLPEDQQPAK